MFRSTSSNTVNGEARWFDLSIGIYFLMAISAAIIGASSYGRALLLEGIHRIEAVMRPAPQVQPIRRVLVVTNDARMRRNVVATAGARGFEAVTASNAAQAREMALRGGIDVVVVDSTVPGAASVARAVPQAGKVTLNPRMSADVIAPLLLARM